MTNKKTDFAVLIILLFFSIILAHITRSTLFGNVTIFSAIFSVPPTIYLSLRSKKNWKKIAISMFLFGLLFLFPFDLIAQYTSIWNTLSYIFLYHIAGIKLTADNLIWGILMTMYIVTFYQHFAQDKINSSKISSRFWSTVIISLIVITIILITIKTFPKFFLSIPHPYLILGILAIIPTILFGLYKPSYKSKMAMVGIFFFFFFFAQEMLGVEYSYWIYPGNNYLGWVNILGISFPFEELLFWMMGYAATLVSYYELFINDRV